MAAILKVWRFILFWHSGIGGRRETLFKLWPAIIGWRMMSETCFNAPIENALWGSQFAVNGIKNRGTTCWILKGFHTDRDNRGDLIICLMLCYSNGTDKICRKAKRPSSIAWVIGGRSGLQFCRSPTPKSHETPDAPYHRHCGTTFHLNWRTVTLWHGFLSVPTRNRQAPVTSRNAQKAMTANLFLRGVIWI